MWIVKQLAYINMEVTSTCTKIVEAQLKDADAMFTRTVSEMTQVENDLRSRISSLELLAEVEKKLF